MCESCERQRECVCNMLVMGDSVESCSASTIVWTRSRTGDLSYAEHPCSLFVRFDDGVKSELAFLFDVKSIDLSCF